MCKWDLTHPVLRSPFGLFVFLLWLGIHNRGVLFVQIQLNIKGVQPVVLFFQLILKGKGLLHLGLCVRKLQGFRISGLGGFQSGGDFSNLVFNTGQISQSVRA